MKKYILLVIFLISALCSCSRDAGVGSISLDSAGTTCGYKGVTVKVGVSSDVSWETVTDTSFLMVSPDSYSGSCRVSITVPPSSLKEDHDIQLIFRSVSDHSVMASYTVSQESAPYLELDQDTVRVAAAGESFSVALRSNMKWELNNKLIIDTTMTNYIKLDPVEGTGDATLNITVPKNPKKRQRILYPEFIMSEDPGDKVTLTIIQSK